MIPSESLHNRKNNVHKEQLIQDNIGLIYMVINRFRYRCSDRDDLFQTAAIGLLKAIDAFNPTYGVCFSTYAVPVMLGEVKRYLRDNTSIKVSRSYKTLATKALALRQEITEKYGHEPTIGHLANILQVSPEELGVALAASQQIISLDECYGEDQNPLKNILPAPENGYNIADKITLYQLIEQLPEREQRIIFLRYFKEQTQSQVAAQMGVSQVQISRLEKKILFKLRQELC